MTPNGHLSLLRSLPFFLCFVAPSIGLNCLLAAKNIGPGKLYDKADLLKDLREKFGTLEKFNTFDPSNPEDALQFGKAAAFALGSNVFKQQCIDVEKCCAEFTFTHKSKPVQFFTCSPICNGEEVFKTCEGDMCNRKEGFGEEKEISDEKTNSLVGQAMGLLKEISPEIKAAIEEQQRLAQPTTGGVLTTGHQHPAETSTAKPIEAAPMGVGVTGGGEQTSGHCHLLMILSICYIFM